MTIDPTTRRPSVVLVEDDANVSFLLTRRLIHEGFEVARAATITGSRPLFAAGTWDIAVLDRRLPDGDGLELCAALRDEAEHGYLVVLTGDGSEESKLAGFKSGADDYVTKPFSLDEFVARLRAGARIVSLQKQLIESNRRLEELSTLDALTSLYNRRAFDREFSVLFDRARRYDRPLSLAIIDVDRFKAINDTFGHSAGDDVLRVVAKLLASSTRATDLLARVGGEEFAIVMPETGLFEATQAMEKLRASIAAAPMTTKANVTVSIGAASIPHSDVASSAELYRLADQALYRAKADGRNTVSLERRKRRFLARDKFLARCSA